MKEGASPSGVSLSALGQDNSIKRQSGSKSGGKLTYRIGICNSNDSLYMVMPRTASAGFLASQRGISARRRALYGICVVFLFLTVALMLLIRDFFQGKDMAEDSDPVHNDMKVSELSQFAPLEAQLTNKRQVLTTEVGSTAGIGSTRSIGSTRDSSSTALVELERKREKKKQKKDKKRKKVRGKGSRDNLGRIRQPSLAPLPFNPLEPKLDPSHPCSNFSLPPPPSDPKRTGPRPCPVCYIPVGDALAMRPERGRESARPILKELTFMTAGDTGELNARAKGLSPRFAGHQTLEERKESFHITPKMKVHCGFVYGRSPGDGTGFDSSAEDRAYMHSCRDVVVASAIFGAYDLVQQPSGISEAAKEGVCFVMFVDQVTHKSFLQDGTLRDSSDKHVGLWRLVVVSDIPYDDPRRTGKIPKLLAHRLFPNAQFSIWVDAKLELRVDPYKILERFLWRGNFTWAISKHYKRFDIFEEAERNKAAGKYKNASIDEQVGVYRTEGMTPYSEAKMPIVSDVPEGCVIVRELTPLTNLLACIWFNEVDRFTSRDQLSFGFCRDRIRAGVPDWNVNMFLDCERRNFVVQNYHKDVLAKKFGNASLQTGAGRQ